MGLDTSHDCWHGPYSSFGRWRGEVAKAVGVTLSEMEGFGGTTEWKTLSPDPIHTLLNHSDCEGEILAADCLPLAIRLEEVAPTLPGDDGFPRGLSARAKAIQFAAGLREAAAKNENVEFA